MRVCARACARVRVRECLLGVWGGTSRVSVKSGAGRWSAVALDALGWAAPLPEMRGLTVVAVPLGKGVKGAHGRVRSCPCRPCEAARQAAGTRRQPDSVRTRLSGLGPGLGEESALQLPAGGGWIMRRPTGLSRAF